MQKEAGLEEGKGQQNTRARVGREKPDKWCEDKRRIAGGVDRRQPWLTMRQNAGGLDGTMGELSLPEQIIHTMNAIL